MAHNPVDDLTSAVKDAAFVSVGLSVLAVQRLQVRRQELKKALDGRTDEASGVLGTLVTHLGQRAKLVEERLGALRDR